MDHDLFSKRTDAIVAMLRDFVNLNEGLPYEVVVHKGPRLNATGAGEVWVWRSGIDDTELTMGGEQAIFDGVWAVACVTRWAARPEDLEDYVSILAANVWRCLCANALNPGFWRAGVPGGSDAVTIRDEADQAYEVEVITYGLVFEDNI